MKKMENKSMIQQLSNEKGWVLDTYQGPEDVLTDVDDASKVNHQSKGFLLLQRSQKTPK